MAVRILVEAFACAPGSGSEEGVGWSYPREFARRGHDVTVITSAQAREAVEAELRADPMPGLRFAYVPRRRWPLRLGWTAGSAVQYLLWLWEASELARRLDGESPFDVLHHSSYGTLLGGSFLWRLGRPLVFGPAGGGQTTPPAFRGLFGSWWRSEALRSLVVRHLWRFVWHSREMARRAAVILASNEETLLLARRMGARRVRLLMDAALPATMAPPAMPEREAHDGLRLLWLGRIMPRKAVQLAVLAVEGLPDTAGVTLEVVGKGANDEMEAGFRRWLAGRPETGRVTAPGAVPFDAVPGKYLAADVFIFTSVRDSTGVQVLEAMAYGLPVICLDHQGARVMVPDEGGLRVRPSDLEGTVAGLQQTILALAGDDELRRAMGRVNHERARQTTWPRLAEAVLGVMDEVVEAQRPAGCTGEAPAPS